MKDEKIFFLICVFLIMALFSGLRGSVGSDTLAYLDIYSRSPRLGDFLKAEWGIEPGFLLLNSIHKTLFDNEFLYIFGYSVFQAFLVIVLCRKSRNPSLFILVYVIIFYLNFHFNIIRAGSATIILLLALQSKSLLRALLIFVIGLMFHFSIIIAFPLILVGRNLSFERIMLACLCALSLAIFFVWMFWERIFLKFIVYIEYFQGFEASYFLLSFFTLSIFMATLIFRKGNIPFLYVASGVLLVASMGFTAFFPGFYRFIIISIFLFFWYFVEYFERPVGGYAICFYVFFLCHSVLSIYQISVENEVLERRVAVSDSPNDQLEKALDSTYIPYSFYWDDFSDDK